MNLEDLFKIELNRINHLATKLQEAARTLREELNRRNDDDAVQ